jgi:AraC-like DNA-binding protein
LYLAEILLLAVEAPNTGAAKISRRIVENGKKKLVGIVEEHMIRNMASCIRARDIARAVGVSESTLRHAFKQTTGTTVADRLAEIRITRAKDLLRESDLSITGISDRVGYPSIHSFSRAFKRLVGMTPCEYSRSIGSGPNRPIAGNDKKNAVPAKDNPSCV